MLRNAIISSQKPEEKIAKNRKKVPFSLLTNKTTRHNK